MIIGRIIEGDTVIAKLTPETVQEKLTLLDLVCDDTVSPDFIIDLEPYYGICAIWECGILTEISDTDLIEDSYRLAEMVRQAWFEIVEGLR